MSYKNDFRDDTGMRKRGGRQSGIDVPYIEPDMLPTREDIEALTQRDRNGRFVAPGSISEADAYERWVEAEWLKTPMGQGKAARGNPDLGTFRSARKAKDLIRDSLRRETCETCGNLLDAGRSDARFCSNACKQKHYRATRKAAPVQPVKGDRIRYGSAAPVEGVMKPRTTSMLMEVLVEYTVLAWKLPYPDVYEEPEWRRMQAFLLRDVHIEECSQPKPSVTRLRRRLRAKLRTIEQVALQNDPQPSTANVSTSEALTAIHRIASQAQGDKS